MRHCGRLNMSSSRSAEEEVDNPDFNPFNDVPTNAELDEAFIGSNETETEVVSSEDERHSTDENSNSDDSDISVIGLDKTCSDASTLPDDAANETILAGNIGGENIAASRANQNTKAHV